MTCTISITDKYAIIKGKFPVQEVDLVTSFAVQGAEFSQAYKMGKWDGRQHLFNSRNGVLPIGLVESVQKRLTELNVPVDIDDRRDVPLPKGGHFDLEGTTFNYPYDYQLDVAKTMVAKKSGIVKVATNGGKTEISCAVTRYLGLRTLFIVSSQELLYQAQKRFMSRLGADEVDIGIVGNGEWRPGRWVTIAMLPTLTSRASTDECIDLLSNTEVVFFDECHHLGSDTWYKLALAIPAVYRFGLSGTPTDRTDEASMRLIAAMGEEIVSINNKFLVERGVSAKAHIIFDKITEPVLPSKTKYATAYKEGVSQNAQALEKVVQWALAMHQAGIGVLILCEEIAHGRSIDNALWTHPSLNGAFIPHAFIHGSETSEVRKDTLDKFAKRELPVLIASTILDEGVDVHSIDGLILAGSKKSKIKTMQRLGRGLRGKGLIVVEFLNLTHKYLVEHSMVRYNDYKNEDCFPLYASGPSRELIEGIWNGEET